MQRVGIKSIKKLNKSYHKYDLEISDNHNFFSNNILVHNCRMITKCDATGIPRFFSREGKEFFTLDLIKEEIMKLPLELRIDKVFDGEICIVDEDGNEDYKSIMNVIKKKNFTILNPRYIMFDYIEMVDFISKKGVVDFYTRYKNLDKFKFNSKFITVEKQIVIESQEHFQELRDNATGKGWEGLIIRKNVAYAGKRSNDMLKVKNFIDAEYEVTGIETGSFRIIDKVTKLEKEEVMLARVNILHKGNVVGVGSGFSIKQRQYYFLHPEEIIGKIITVKYFEECFNNEGKKSLRFPVLKHIYDGERDT